MGRAKRNSGAISLAGFNLALGAHRGQLGNPVIDILGIGLRSDSAYEQLRSRIDEGEVEEVLLELKAAGPDVKDNPRIRALIEHAVPKYMRSVASLQTVIAQRAVYTATGLVYTDSSLVRKNPTSNTLHLLMPGTSTDDHNLTTCCDRTTSANNLEKVEPNIWRSGQIPTCVSCSSYEDLQTIKSSGSTLEGFKWSIFDDKEDDVIGKRKTPYVIDLLGEHLATRPGLPTDKEKRDIEIKALFQGVADIWEEEKLHSAQKLYSQLTPAFADLQPAIKKSGIPMGRLLSKDDFLIISLAAFDKYVNTKQKNNSAEEPSKAAPSPASQSHQIARQLADEFMAINIKEWGKNGKS